MKLSAQLNRFLWSGFRTDLKFSNCEVCYESAPENLFKLRVLYQCANHSPAIKNWGSPGSFLRYRRLNTKYKAFLDCSFVPMATYYVTLIKASRLVINIEK